MIDCSLRYAMVTTVALFYQDKIRMEDYYSYANVNSKDEFRLFSTYLNFNTNNNIQSHFIV